MAGVGKSFHFLLVLSVVFLLLSVSVRCNNVEELNQDNVIRVYNLTFKSLIASFGGPHPDNGAEFRVTVASPYRLTNMASFKNYNWGSVTSKFKLYIYYRNACEPINPPPKSDSRVSAAQLWIVLIRRKGSCFTCCCQLPIFQLYFFFFQTVILWKRCETLRWGNINLHYCLHPK